MSVLGYLRPRPITKAAEHAYVVVHPLDDRPEQKVDISTLGPMPMTTSVKLSLMALRGCLILMMLLVLYHVMELAGAFRTHAR
jgi:hypothetical protein